MTLHHEFYALCDECNDEIETADGIYCLDCVMAIQKQMEDEIKTLKERTQELEAGMKEVVSMISDRFHYGKGLSKDFVQAVLDKRFKLIQEAEGLSDEQI